MKKHGPTGRPGTKELSVGVSGKFLLLMAAASAGKLPLTTALWEARKGTRLGRAWISIPVGIAMVSRGFEHRKVSCCSVFRTAPRCTLCITLIVGRDPAYMLDSCGHAEGKLKLTTEHADSGRLYRRRLGWVGVVPDPNTMKKMSSRQLGLNDMIASHMPRSNLQCAVVWYHWSCCCIVDDVTDQNVDSGVILLLKYMLRFGALESSVVEGVSSS